MKFKAMNADLQQKINNVTGYRSSRLDTAQFIIAHPIYFKELLHIGFEVNHTDGYKACWVLEFVAYEKLDWFQEYLDFFFENLKSISNESAIRPLAKINLLLLQSHYSKKTRLISLSENQLQIAIEINFDWLISDTKVATKYYAIKNLYLLGKQFDWIHPELRIILEKEYAQQSPAFKAVAREVLKKIK